MLNEPASSFEFIPPEAVQEQQLPQTPTEALLKVRELVAEYMEIVEELFIDEDDLPAEDRTTIIRGNSVLAISFVGKLKDDAEWVYVELDKALQQLGMYPLLRQNTQGSPELTPHLIHIIDGRLPKPQTSKPTWNIVLFIATIISVLLTGTLIAAGEIALTNPTLSDSISGSVLGMLTNIWRGFPYALAIMAILGTHEMGHYLMMRRHNKAASLPYFIPAFLISPFGTLGAVIALRESLRNRKQLLDVGASGPIAGFIVAVPILFIGLATSKLISSAELGTFVEGNSILYALAKYIVHGQWLPNADYDVAVNQLAWAGWTGLFVTALNMIPIGQLDGGHVLYSLFGDRARRIFIPAIAAMVALFLFLSSAWLVLIFILPFVGRVYAVPQDNITPLDTNRRYLAWFALFIFVISFTPIPIYERGVDGSLLGGMGWIGITTTVSIVLLQLRRLRS